MLMEWLWKQHERGRHARTQVDGVPVGQSESPWRTPSHETTNGASVEVAVGFNACAAAKAVEQESRYAGLTG